MLELVADDKNLCGEGPIWDNGLGRLIWTDIESNLVYQILPTTGAKTVINRGLNVAGIALRKGRGLVFAGATGLHLWNGPGDVRTVLREHEGEALAFNDIIADAKGRIYAGTVYWGATSMQKHGKLYLIDARGRATIAADGIELSNGLAFSPDDRTLYYADSAARRIYAYKVEPKTGALSARRVFVQVPGEEGLPDGLTVDADGFVWSAQWYGSQVVRYDPDGHVERRVAVPAKQVSSVAFGGDDLKDLYITTAANSWAGPLVPPGYDAASGNIGGALYRMRVDFTQGRAEHLAAML